jgi:quercetin dioxygenase-like cupin family protein
MNHKVTPWHGKGEPTEGALRRAMEAEGLSPYAWGNGPGDRYSAHAHAYHKVIYCVQGSIRFYLPDLNGALELRAGDRLDLPALVRHSAVVGPDGVLCLEGHRPAG